MGDPDGAEIDYRALEWVHGIVLDWLAVNETARSRQLAMPPAEQEELARLPAGFGWLGPAMAETVNPETLIVANAVLTSAEVQIRSLVESGPLSHPLGMFGPKSDVEADRVMVGEGPDRVEELERRLREVEAERDGYAQALRMLAVGAEGALRPTARRGTSASTSGERHR